MKKNLKAKYNCIGMDNGEIIDTILEDRGIEDLNEYLHPNEESLIPFNKIKNIDKAYQIIDDGISIGYKFLVLADVDVDGCSAGAIMVHYLRKSGAEVECIINQGKEHGCSNLDLDILNGFDIFIVVDSIDNDPDVYKRIVDKGVDLLVIDHHIPKKELLECNVPFTLVSSAIDYPNPDLSGSGMVFKVVQYIDEMNLTDYSDDLWVYAGLGIVSDMCSLASKENRYIVLKSLADYKNPLVKAMVGTYQFNSEAISFSIAPLINACNRLSKNEIALNAFLTNDEYEITEYVKQMKKCKEEQNAIVDSILPDLEMQGETQLNNKAMYFILGDVDAEIAGLLGNRLLSVYQRPLFVIHDCGDKYMGSMRAIGVENMLKIVNDTGLANCAGHELAAGFEVDKSKFDEFKIKIEEILSNIEFSTEIIADIEIEPSQVNDALIQSLNALNRISGRGCPAITVLMRTKAYEVSTFSTRKHLKIIDDETGVLFTKWNDKSFETMTNDKEFIGVGTLSSPYYGRTKYYQLTLNEYTTQN